MVVSPRALPKTSFALQGWFKEYQKKKSERLTDKRSLATLFRQDYLTPELVSIAADKVLGHRIRLEKGKEGSAKVIAEVLRVVNVPV